MSEGTGGTELVEVRLLGMPIEERRLASEHVDELMREFALIREQSDSPVPHRLVELRDKLTRDYKVFTKDARIEVDAAAAQGTTAIDLRYFMPPSAAAAAEELGGLLDEADAFCRDGDHLLTLATPERALRFRRWYLGEFTRQIAGEAPRPWS